MALTQEQVSQLYVALFGRASEGAGNKSWIDRGLNQVETAKEMIASDAAKDYFGRELTNLDFVTFIYANTLGFTHDKEGIANWTAKLDAGISRGELVVDIITAALSSEFEGSAPQNQLLNRIEVSNYMATNVEKVAPENVASTQFQSSDNPNGKLNVTDVKSTVFSAKSAIDEMSGGTVIDGETLTLTTGVDTFTGADANDLFTGVVSGLVSEGTLNPKDTIDGAGGTDTLRLDMKGNFSGFTGSISNVENVELTNATTIARTFDAKNISGVEKYTLDSAKGINLSNVAATGIEVAYEGTQGNTTIGFASKATNATTDAMTISVNGLGAAKVLNTDGTEKTAQVNSQITMAGVEDVTLKTTGTESFVNLSAMDATTLTANGSANLTISAVKNGLTSVDASALSANLTANLNGVVAANSLKSIVTSTGDDSITAVTASLTANALIALGEGTDKLTLTGAAATTQFEMSGVETVAFENSAATDAVFSAKNVTGLSTVEISDKTLNNVSVVNLGAADITLSTVGVTTTGKTTILDNSGATTINMTAKDAATAAKSTTGGAETAKGDVTLSNSTSVTVNVDDYVTYDATATLLASKASEVTLNVDSAKNANTTPAEQTAFNAVLKASNATNLTVNSEGNTNLALGSALGSVQTATIVAGGVVNIAQAALDAAADLTLSGTEKTAKVTTGTIGKTDMDYSTNVSATGLKAGLVLGDIASKQDATVNLTGTTGTVELGGITAANVTVNASSLAGTLSLTATKTIQSGTANTGAANIDVSSSAAAVTVGAIGTTSAFKTVSVNASNGAKAVVIGAITALDSINVNFAGNLATSEVGALTAKAVTVNADNAIGVVDTGDATVTDSYTYTAGLKGEADAVVIKTTDAATATTVTLNGNIGADKFAITGGAHSAAASTLTVKGNLDIGANTVAVTSNATDTGVATIDLSGLTGTAAAGAITVVAGAGADIITASNSGTTITGGAGADTINLGTGADTVVFSAAAVNGHDTIKGFDFTAGSLDVLKVTALGGLDGSGAIGGIAVTNAIYVGATAAGTKGDTAVSKVIVIGDADKAAADWSNVLAKLNGAVTVAGDTTAANADTVLLINNGTDTRVYLFSDDATNNTAIEATELTLVGTLDGINTSANFVEGSFNIA